MPTAVILILTCLFFYRELLFAEIFSPAGQLFWFPPWSSLGSPNFHSVNGLRSDDTFIYYPLRFRIWEQLREGIFPFWDNSVQSGTPAFLSGQVLGWVLYPLHLSFYLLEFNTAYTVFHFMLVFFSGLFMYLFLRKILLSNWSSLAGAAVFMFYGWTVVWLSAPGAMISLFLPFVLYCVELVIENCCVNTVSMLALGVAFQSFAGHPPQSILLVLVLVAYIAFRLFTTSASKSRKLQLGFGFGASLVLGLVSSAATVFPMFDWLNAPRVTRYQLGIAPGIPAELLVTYLVPNFYGNPIHGLWLTTSNYCEAVNYVGILSIFLAVVAVILSRRERHVYFFGALAAFAVVMTIRPLVSWGAPFQGIAGIALYPVLVAANARWAMNAHFAFAVLAAFGLERVLESDRVRERVRLLRWVVVGTSIMLVTVVAWTYLLVYGPRDPAYTSVYWYLAFVRAAGTSSLGMSIVVISIAAATVCVITLTREKRYTQIVKKLLCFAVLGSLLLLSVVISIYPGAMVVSPLAELNPVIVYLFKNLTFFFVLVVGSLVLLVVDEKTLDVRLVRSLEKLRFVGSTNLSKGGLNLKAFLLLSVIVIDGFAFGINFNPSVPRQFMYPATGGIEYLQHDHAVFRTISIPSYFPFFEDISMVYGVENALGYDPTVNMEYARYFSAMSDGGVAWANGDPSTGVLAVTNSAAAYSPLLDLLNVKYVLTAPGQTVLSYPLVYSGPDMWIYENIHCMPRAWFTSNIEVNNNFNETIRILEESRGSVAVVAGHPADFSSFGGLAGTPGAVRISRYDSNGYELELHASGPGMLVISTRYDSSWKATVNGAGALVYKVDSILLGVYVGRGGDYDVHLSFQPRNMTYGLWISAISLASIFVCIVCLALRRKMKSIYFTRKILPTSSQACFRSDFSWHPSGSTSGGVFWTPRSGLSASTTADPVSAPVPSGLVHWVSSCKILRFIDLTVARYNFSSPMYPGALGSRV